MDGKSPRGSAGSDTGASGGKHGRKSVSYTHLIIAYREANGPFGSIEEIMNIEGIKGKMFEKIRGSIEV